jgi:hypothetical protein
MFEDVKRPPAILPSSTFVFADELAAKESANIDPDQSMSGTMSSFGMSENRLESRELGPKRRSGGVDKMNAPPTSGTPGTEVRYNYICMYKYVLNLLPYFLIYFPIALTYDHQRVQSGRILIRQTLILEQNERRYFNT